ERARKCDEGGRPICPPHQKRGKCDEGPRRCHGLGPLRYRDGPRRLKLAVAVSQRALPVEMGRHRRTCLGQSHDARHDCCPKSSSHVSPTSVFPNSSCSFVATSLNHGIEPQDDCGYCWKASAYLLQGQSGDHLRTGLWLGSSTASIHPRGNADAAHEEGSSIRCTHLEASPTRARLAQEGRGTLLG